MSAGAAPIGSDLAELETPALVVDLVAMEQNLRRMADFFARAPASLRPHVKNHRTPALAQLQLAAGARGVCCGNLAEAEVMSAAGIDDLLITRQIVQPGQIARLALLAGRAAVMVVVDDAAIVRRLDRAGCAAGSSIGVLVDVDVRLGRSGVAPGAPALRLAEMVAASPGLRFCGLMGYEGSMHGLTAEQRAEECRRALGLLVATAKQVERAGIAVPVVSAGATSTYAIAATTPGVSEVQAGSYLLGDGRYRQTTPEFAPAVAVLASVISRPSATRVTIDAGQKKLTADGGLPEPAIAGLRVVALNEEHGQLERYADGPRLRVGDTLMLTPQHASTTINLYERIYGLRDGKVVTVWEVTARGL